MVGFAPFLGTNADRGTDVHSNFTRHTTAAPPLRQLVKLLPAQLNTASRTLNPVWYPSSNAPQRSTYNVSRKPIGTGYTRVQRRGLPGANRSGDSVVMEYRFVAFSSVGVSRKDPALFA